MKVKWINEHPVLHGENSPAVMTHTVLPPPNTSHMQCLNPSQASWYSIYLPHRDGRLSWPRWLATYRDGLPPVDGHPSEYYPGQM